MTPRTIPCYSLSYPMCLMLQEKPCVKGHQTMTFKIQISSYSFMSQIQIWNHSVQVNRLPPGICLAQWA